MKIIDQFRSHLIRLGYGKSSIKMLPSCVGDFIKFTNQPIEQVRSQDIIGYYEHLKQRPRQRGQGGLSESYINHHIYSLKLFFAWQEQSGLIKFNPISSLSFKQPESKRRSILSIAEVHQLYEVSESKKDKAILSLFYGCGLRRSEGERLNIKDVHFRSGLLYVRSGKGGKRRVVPMSEKVSADIKDYLENERSWKGEKSALILHSRGSRMRGETYNTEVKKLVNRSGIKKQISLHSLRHSIATHLLEGGLSVEYVRSFLGHKHLESTQIYTHVNKEQLWNLLNT